MLNRLLQISIEQRFKLQLSGKLLGNVQFGVTAKDGDLYV
jgi:hypothetical protein